MEFYYVTYQVVADSAGIGSSYVTMGMLDDYDITEKYIVQYFYDGHQSVFIDAQEAEGNSYEITADYNATPHLVTNDPRFYLLYKGVFSPTEFRLFCQVNTEISNMTPIERFKLDIGQGSPAIYEHFQRLISGEGRYVYEFESYETEHDEESGMSYRMPVGSGWRFRETYLENDRIRQRFKMHK